MKARITKKSVNLIQKFDRKQRHPSQIEFIFYICTAFTLTSCTIVNDTCAPNSTTDTRHHNFGSIFNNSEIILKKKEKRKKSLIIKENSKINKFLWQGALDTLSFMQIRYASPEQGRIVTDWYVDPDTPDIKVRVFVRILSKTLRADAVKIKVDRQKLKLNTWIDYNLSKEDCTKLEIMIVERARKLFNARVSES